MTLSGRPTQSMCPPELARSLSFGARGLHSTAGIGYMYVSLLPESPTPPLNKLHNAFNPLRRGRVRPRIVAALFSFPPEVFGWVDGRGKETIFVCGLGEGELLLIPH